MKIADLKPCAMCHRPVGKANGLLFYHVRLTRMAFDHRAISEVTGLQMIVGSLDLAQTLAPDSDVAKPLTQPVEFLLCDDCAMNSTCVAALEEIGGESAPEGRAS